jgi:hypothetical protein
VLRILIRFIVTPDLRHTRFAEAVFNACFQIPKTKQSKDFKEAKPNPSKI